jgi:D-beta-D-heptose 7-phosphate kinase/D-beta-D-heptose 1-phosphate adenosyltransferase
MDDQALAEVLATGTVAVIGDVVVDHYVTGAVGRISPEAPVPILHVTAERHVLGGAANVAANVAALGGRARLVGVIGSDGPGNQLIDMIKASGRIEPSLIFSKAHPTIIKTRYVSGQQQLVRVDREVMEPFPKATVAALIEEIKDAIEESDCVVLSDYGKGVLSDPVIAATLEAARRAGKLTIVDPKRRSFEPYRGADYITPNRKELTDATGLPCTEDDEAERAAAAAMAQSDASLLLTRSERGMSLYRAGAAPLHFKAQALEVFDVSGAGDTVVASLALSLAAKLPVEQALRVANTAAGVVVAKLGTATCSVEELNVALAKQAHPVAARAGIGSSAAVGVTPLSAATQIRAEWAKAGLKVGFANGCFDLIHPGHVTLLRQAAEACDRLIVAINSDASVSALKGPTRPVQGEEARAQVLNAVKGVDMVVVFSDPTPLALVQALQPDVIVKGSDYTEDQVVGADIVKARGGRVLLVDLVAGQSTSALVRRANQVG